MIDELLEVLQRQKLVITETGSDAMPIIQDEDIADALWLASQMGGARELPDAKPGEDPEGSDGPLPSRVIDAVSSPQVAMPSVPAVMPQVPEQAEDTAAEVPEQGLPIQVQAAPALPEKREIARALRSLMRKVPSRTRSVLDEQTTVNRIAESGIWQLAFKPALERWFDLELVIESSEFSFVWQETLDEFRQLLERQGAFRNVRTWHVEGAQTGRPQLMAKARQLSEAETQPTRSERELVDVSGRRLVLYVSDCRSLLWQQGKIHDWLRLWSEHGPTAVVQLLPERLWPESELDVGYAVQVGSLVPGALNKKLQVRELSPLVEEIDEADSLTLPVVTLTAAALKQWALVVAAAGRQRAPARLFDMAWVKDAQWDAVDEMTRPESAEARVELFEATASPAAQQLARRMAAVPVEMPVVHLIQEVLRPSVTITPVHIAEVYDSGLLIAKNGARNDESVRYDFYPGVRTYINRKTPLDETLGTIEALSQQIATTLGFNIKSFTALLSPKSDWTEGQKEAVLPFAQVTTGVLHRLGGDYAALAQLVEGDAQKRPDWIKPFEEDDPGLADTDFPGLEPFDFIDAQLVETEEPFPPPLQTEEFTVVTFEQRQEPLVLQDVDDICSYLSKAYLEGRLQEIKTVTSRTLEFEISDFQLDIEASSSYRYDKELMEVRLKSFGFETLESPSSIFMFAAQDNKNGAFVVEARLNVVVDVTCEFSFYVWESTDKEEIIIDPGTLHEAESELSVDVLISLIGDFNVVGGEIDVDDVEIISTNTHVVDFGMIEPNSLSGDDYDH